MNTMTTADLKTMSPKEIDTVLAANWEKQSRLMMEVYNLKTTIKMPLRYGASAVRRAEGRLPEAQAALAALVAEAEPFEAEFRARPWKRYFLVTNGNGHVHRERNCSTCFPTTSYGWLFDLSGCDEKEMVAEYGEKACTVCFPEAPVMARAMGTSRHGRIADAARAEREAKRSAAAAKKAEKAIANADGSRLLGANGKYDRIETLAAAKMELVHLTGTVVVFRNFQPGSVVAQNEAEYFAAIERIAAAIAHKTGAEVATIKAEAEKKARKRGY